MLRVFGASGAAGIPARATCPRMRLPVTASLRAIHFGSCRIAASRFAQSTDGLGPFRRHVRHGHVAGSYEVLPKGRGARDEGGGAARPREDKRLRGQMAQAGIPAASDAPKTRRHRADARTPPPKVGGAPRPAGTASVQARRISWGRQPNIRTRRAVALDGAPAASRPAAARCNGKRHGPPRKDVRLPPKSDASSPTRHHTRASMRVSSFTFR